MKTILAVINYSDRCKKKKQSPQWCSVCNLFFSCSEESLDASLFDVEMSSSFSPKTFASEAPDEGVERRVLSFHLTSSVCLGAVPN